MTWDWDKLQEKRQRQQQHPEPRRDPGDAFEPPEGQEKPLPVFPPKFSTRGTMWLLIALIAAWLLSGIYIVNPDEQGVVLRFGKYNRTLGAGPHYALPFPFESVDRPKVTQVQRVEVGFRSANQNRRFQQGQYLALPEESSTLTGDENIVNVQFSVQYQIKDAVQFLYNVTNQAAVVKNAAEAAMREVIGNSLIDSVLTDGKLKIQQDATDLLQNILDRYKVGVRVLAVQLQDVHPPKEVIDAFKDVASAREDKSRIINEAEAYRNELLPKARGKAVEIENGAKAYRETRIRNAEGEAKRFTALLEAYSEAKDVTRRRLYLEVMESILGSPGIKKVILPNEGGGKLLPLLPMFQQPGPQTPPAQPRSAS
ncbi:MAG: FtsH protease activity modulator HflK [Desulfovibrionaceae bacterium]|nr:FtsH protease activity modulator HflK [Desulfovibrionaceae bacterium]